MASQQRRRWAAERVALMVLAPLLLIGALELLLWALGFSPPEDSLSNREYPFDPAAMRARLRSPDGRPVVLCLGESSMAGYPLDGDMATPGFSLCDRVARTVGARAVNLAEGGIAMRHVAERAAVACERPLPPGSLVLVYGGHNEFLNVPRVPPRSAGIVRVLGRLRLFRLLQRELSGPSQTPESLADAGEPMAERADILAAFEAAFRDVVGACKGTPTVVATVIGNPAFHVPDRPSSDEGGDGETLRQYLRRRRRAHTESADSFNRELLIAPAEINDAIVRVAAETSTPLLDTRALPVREPVGFFLDWVHPTDALHQTLAAAFLGAAADAGYWRGNRTPLPTAVPPARVQWAAERCAADNVKLDPVFAIAQLRQMSASADGLRVGLARLVAGFLTDSLLDVREGLAVLERYLATPAHQAVVDECLAALAAEQDGRLPCLPWSSTALMSADEKMELLGVVPGASAEARRLLEAL